MISIRKYLDAMRLTPPDAEASFHASMAQLAAALVSEISAEGESGSDSALTPFSMGLREIQRRFDAAESAEEIQAIQVEVSKVLCELRRAKQELDRRQTEEVQKMVGMLQQAIEALSRRSNTSVSHLRMIEADIRAASQISEIVALRERLRRCVDQIRDTAASEQREFAKTREQLERDYRLAQQSAALARMGLGGRVDAERRITEAGDEVPWLAVLLERLAAIKARYGTGVSEKYLLGFTVELGRILPSPTKIFRWSERALVAELPAPAGVSGADGGELNIRARLSGVPSAVQVDLGGRTAVLEASYRWCYVSGGRGRGDAVRQIEDFLGV